MIVIEVYVHRGHAHVVMRVMRGGHARCEVALVMVVHIAQAGDAMRGRIGGQTIRLQCTAH